MSTSLIISIISLIFSAIALLVALLRNRLMTKQMKLASAISIINWLDAVRPQRHLLYKIKGKPFNEWSEKEKTAANDATRQYDILGVMENLGYVDKQFVDRFYAISVHEIWEICKDWIIEERSLRGKNHLWEFQKLAEEVEQVKMNHPANTNADWPRKARRQKPA
jgi:hypothetical protein